MKHSSDFVTETMHVNYNSNGSIIGGKTTGEKSEIEGKKIAKKRRKNRKCIIPIDKLPTSHGDSRHTNTHDKKIKREKTKQATGIQAN